MLNQIHETSPAALQAHQKHFKYAGYGKWKDQSGNTVAKTVKNKLVLIKPAKSDASTILHKKVGDAKGSNPGGLYIGSDGIRRYVKFYNDPIKAHVEHLANHLYILAGIGAPKSQTFSIKGSIGYASQIIDADTDLTHLPATKRKHIANKILDGFVMDVLLANWDVVDGAASSNVVVKNNTPYRIDNGGSLIFRAQAGRKPVSLLNDIPEWNGFSDPDVNYLYYNIFRQAGMHGPQDMMSRIRSQVRAINAAVKSRGGWKSIVDSIIPAEYSKDRTTITKMLVSRFDKLKEKVHD